MAERSAARKRAPKHEPLRGAGGEAGEAAPLQLDQLIHEPIQVRWIELRRWVIHKYGRRRTAE